MTLRARGRLVLVVVLLAIVILGGIVAVAFHDVSRERAVTSAQLRPAVDEVSELLLSTSDMERGLWGYAISGDVAFLTPYALGRATSATSFAQLDSLLTGSEADLRPLLEQAEKRRADWLTYVAEPQVALIQQGQKEAAQQSIAVGVGRRSFTLLRTDLVLLQDRLEERIAAAGDRTNRLTNELAIVLGAVGVAVVLLTLAGAVVLVTWVLRPLADLRGQMRRLARENDTSTPLEPDGPPEIAALGRDAELLRQHLVDRIDAASAADEGLSQEAPIVDLLRAQLSSPEGAELPGSALGIARLTAAGVMAGDWWQTVTLAPDRGGLFLSDISGHDPAAGIAAVRFRTGLEAAMRSGQGLRQSLVTAASLFTAEPNRFASCIAVQVGPDGLLWLNAGHPAGIVVRADRSTELLTPTGPIVSSLGGAWTWQRTAFGAGDAVVLYTDGLVEGRDAQGEEIGIEAVCSWASELATESLADPADDRAGYLAKGLLDRARSQAEDLRDDDVTVLVVIPR